jgi:hypothetical protein
MRNKVPHETSVVRMSGGLGNQLFQYSFARALAMKNDSNVLIDLDAYDFRKLHNFRKSHLQLLVNDDSKFTFSTSPSKMLFNQFAPKRFVRKLFISYEAKIRLSHTFIGKKVVVEQQLPFDEGMPIGKNYYYVGNFISMAYWHDYFPQILDEIATFVGEYTRLADTESSNSHHDSGLLAIHARRGDYVSNAKTRKFHGYCPDEYYLQAIETMFATSDSITGFLISSDESAYSTHLADLIRRYGLPIRIDLNIDPILSLAGLMNSDFFIGSNSTFSWWAAFLGKRKSLIFPKEWFAESKIVIAPESFYPYTPTLLDYPLST